MNPSVILHIGVSKTGTASIQKALTALLRWSQSCSCRSDTAFHEWPRIRKHRDMVRKRYGSGNRKVAALYLNREILFESPPQPASSEEECR